MPRFPIEYQVDLERLPSGSVELRAGHRPPITLGAPPEFGGSDVWWSPEQLFASAVGACFTETFLAAARHQRLQVGELVCRATAVLTRTTEATAFTSVHLAVRARVESDDVDRTRRLLDDAKERCFVARSIRAPVSLSVEITRS
jgi:organic hydroperoxide reductase OsmC/OhrA